MLHSRNPFSRREFLTTTAAGVTLASAGTLLDDLHAAQAPANSRQASGVKVGEVTADSAIVWVRLTANAAHNAKGTLITKRQPLPKNLRLDQLRGACPGARGRVRLRFGTNRKLQGATSTDWIDVTAKTDYSHQFQLRGLKPGTEYFYAAETTGPGGNPVHAPLTGRFETAPPANEFADASFTVITGKAYKDLDHADGYHMYPAMQRLRPKFIVPTGDTVYYDNDGILAQSVDQARHHWHRMYGLPRHVEFHRNIPGCWEKDDHDCYHDDCWPGMKRPRMGAFTFNQGLGVFREQVPMGRLTYRTFRWGRGLQVWLVEGRDYRSPNTMKDGPNKTIWGAKQKKWLFQSLQQSDAIFKVLVSPTPIVGPDRAKGKRDNHSNVAFQTEGDEIRAFFQKNLPRRFAVCCGDRHWQYHSVHPKTRVQEFSCGPASNRHAGGSPGLDKNYHQFHRVRGGFLSVNFQRRGTDNRLVMRMHDVMGKVVYEHVMK